MDRDRIATPLHRLGWFAVGLSSCSFREAYCEFSHNRDGDILVVYYTAAY
jgi:hypothetical protein